MATQYVKPDLSALPKAKLAEVGKLQVKGDYFFRTIALSDGTVGEAWYRSKPKAEYLDKVLELGEDIPYKTVKNKRDGVNITLYVSEDSDSFQSNASPKTSKQKDFEERESYWRRKEEFEQKRVSINDPKIEFQAYLTVLAPFYVQSAAEWKGKSPNPTDEAVEALYAKAKEIFKRENPEA